MSVIQFPVSKPQAAGSGQTNADLSGGGEGQILYWRRGAVGSTSSEKSWGPVELSVTPSDVGGRDHGKSALVSEFQAQLTSSLDRQRMHLGVPERAFVDARILGIARGSIATLCSDLGVELRPWFRADGALLLMWRRDGVEHVATIWCQSGELQLTLETAQTAKTLRWSLEGLRDFIRGSA